MRHGESLGNQNKIIQGKTNDYGLSDKGKKQIEEIAQAHLKELNGIDKMIVSPTKRTIQTAETIQNCLDKQVPTEINKNIIEFNPGILAGNTHQCNALKYPQYYAIWKKRGDLDGIPGAEKGKALQARVLSFLMDYIDKEEFNDVVVSHAGYLRCLVNTIKGRDRTTPIDSSNGAIHILENPLKNLKIQQKNRAMASKVYIVDTFEDKYVVKIKNRPIQKEDILEKHLLQRMKKKIPDLPTVLNISNTEEGSIKVLEFLDGEHIYGKLSTEELQAMTKKVKKMHQVLKTMPTDHYKIVDLHETMKEKAKHSKNRYVVQTAKEILSDKRNIQKMKKSSTCLVHSDLNRDNILFDNEHQDIHIIDWESVKAYPKDYQLACFLASSVLIEDGSMKEVMQLAHQFQFPIDENYLLFLMKIRIFEGLYYFAENENEYTKSNPKVSREILKKYFIANEKINRYQEKKRQIAKVECKER